MRTAFIGLIIGVIATTMLTITGTSDVFAGNINGLVAQLEGEYVYNTDPARGVQQSQMIQHCHFVVMLEKVEHVPMSQVDSDVTEVISWDLSFLFSLYNISIQ